jgi:ABC-type transport system substrate-binding protein
VSDKTLDFERLTRAEILKLAGAGVAVAGLGLPDSALASAERLGARAPTGRVTLAIPPITPQPTLPHQGAPTTNWPIRETLYETLVRFDAATGKHNIPHLARSWRVSKDFKTWTFRLRRGVRFHRGAGQLTAADVAFSFNLAVWRNDSFATNKQFFQDTVRRITTPDPYTIVFHLREPNYFLDQLTSFDSAVLVTSKRYVERLGIARAAEAPVGTGPYQLDQFRAGVGYQFSYFRGYWGTPPDFAELDIRFVRDDSTRLAMLRTGEADITELPKSLLDDARRAGLATRPTARESVTASYWFGSMYLPNMNGNPWRDRRVRQALNLAVDRKGIASGIFRGLAKPLAFYLTGPRTPGYSEIKRKPYPYDLRRARQLLEAAGHGNGFEVSLRPYALSGVPEINLVTQAIAATWRSIGVNATIRPSDAPTVIGTIRDRRPSDYLFPARTPYNLFAPEGLLDVFFDKDGTWGGIGRTAQGRLQRLLDSLGRTAAPARRKQIIGSIGRLVHDDYWSIPIVSAKAVVAWNPRRVRNWSGTLGFGFDGLTRIRRA